MKLTNFRTYNLPKIHGEGILDKIKTTKQCEDLCKVMFNLKEPDMGFRCMGDFYMMHKNKTVYYDQKKCELIKRGNEEYFVVKFSNVISKIWVQLALTELDNIIYHTKDDMRLKIIRYKTEISMSDFEYIDYVIENHMFLGYNHDSVKSHCLRYKIEFRYFATLLCKQNLKRFANLILFHNPASSDDFVIVKEYEDNTYDMINNNLKYLLTPIDINMCDIKVCYIGFGGFKVTISKNKVTKKFRTWDDMGYLHNELDNILNHIFYQNKVKNSNSVNNLLKKYKEYSDLKTLNEDIWDFSRMNKNEVY